MFIVACIHNNTLGQCISVSSFEEGIDKIKQYIHDRYNRELTEEEGLTLVNDGEVYIPDHDNEVTYSIGTVE